MKFNGICLVTRNVLALTDFYSQVLGVKAEGDETHAEVRTAGANLTIYSEEGMEGMAPNSMQESGNGKTILGFEVENVDQEYARVQSFGVEFILHPTSHPWGTRSCWFRDPDGNIVNFFMHLV